MCLDSRVGSAFAYQLKGLGSIPGMTFSTSYLLQYFPFISVNLEKGFNAQNGLNVMLEILKFCIDKSKLSGALFTDLLKTFDCLFHYLSKGTPVRF